MRIDPAGYPFVGGALAAAVLAGATGGWPFAVPLIVLAGFFLFFFRDPERHTAAQENAVLSPADGRVLVAGPAATAAAPPFDSAQGGPFDFAQGEPGEWLQISIFLSPMDVHVNRVPVSGRVTRVSFQRGRFLPAYHHDAAAANERSEIWIDHHGCPVVARQIVGVLARRVVCRAVVGAEVRAGERYGVMKFGSRMDVFLPTNAELRVKVGDAVRGGETIIAVLH